MFQTYPLNPVRTRTPVPPPVMQPRPARVRLEQIRPCIRDLYTTKRSLFQHIHSFQNESERLANTEGADLTHEFSLLFQDILNLKENLSQTLSLMTNTILGFMTLLFHDPDQLQVWTELYIDSIRRLAFSAAEATNALGIRLGNRRVYCNYSQVEVQPEGQCLALRKAMGLWLAEDLDKSKFFDEPHPMYRALNNEPVKAEDQYLSEIMGSLVELSELLYETCTGLLLAFDLSWPGVGRSINM